MGIWQGNNIFETFLTAVALAVGAIPEGLPAVMTISLAVGVAVMARKNVLIRELKAVETLGNVTVICSDKTGTITQNKMTVVEISDEDKLNALLQVAASCNDAKLPNIGDPTELALLQFATEHKIKSLKRIDETPFSSETKWMSTTHYLENNKVELIKGAPEVVAKFCPAAIRPQIYKAALKMAEQGLRTIAAAERKVGDKQAQFLGIFGLQDPPRPSVKQAIKTARRAGIKVKMITGDHAVTAAAIGQQIDLGDKALEGQAIAKMSKHELQQAANEYNIFARVAPVHKVRICQALQQQGEVVAMTGDGVNDAPALRVAEVGIAMGRVGTAIAREASGLILLDDAFKSIVAGVGEGRRIFINIKKSVAFLLRTNMSEVLLIFIAMLAQLPLPLLPVHLLFLNLLLSRTYFVSCMSRGGRRAFPPRLISHPDPNVPFC